VPNNKKEKTVTTKDNSPNNSSNISNSLTSRDLKDCEPGADNAGVCLSTFLCQKEHSFEI